MQVHVHLSTHIVHKDNHTYTNLDLQSTYELSSSKLDACNMGSSGMLTCGCLTQAMIEISLAYLGQKVPLGSGLLSRALKV